jgi:ABC-type glycerol-3-phosphate transport system substrate-binding protein
MRTSVSRRRVMLPLLVAVAAATGCGATAAAPASITSHTQYRLGPVN